MHRKLIAFDTATDIAEDADMHAKKCIWVVCYPYVGGVQIYEAFDNPHDAAALRASKKTSNDAIVCTTWLSLAAKADAQPAQAVACQHEPFEGFCVHCGIEFVRGRSVETTDECSGDPKDCPRNEGFGCDCQPAQAVTEEMAKAMFAEYQRLEPSDPIEPNEETFAFLTKLYEAAERARSSQPPTAAQPAAVPAECVVVPREPTPEMIAASEPAFRIINGFLATTQARHGAAIPMSDNGKPAIWNAYVAMIAAAPPPPSRGENAQ
jgi:hypothetical protein